MLVWLSVLFLGLCSANPPCSYHQKQDYTYHDNFRSKSCMNQQCSAAPFKSPENSIDAHLLMINEATTSIAIANPVFDSWLSECARYSSDCDSSKCTGCSLDTAQNETFKIFQALLKAMQSPRKIAVKILTNDFSVQTCKNETTLLDWLHINGAYIRMYASTTFLHAKFMMIDDGKKILVSSVNFSEESFMKNRETGVIVSDCDCEALDLYNTVFESDWQEGYDFVLTNTYTNEQMKFIKSSIDPSPIPYKEIESFPNVDIVATYVAPDYARQTFFEYLNSTQHSLLIHIYIITDVEICDQIVALHNNGIDVSVLVSDNIASHYLNKKREACYNKIKEAGIHLVRNKQYPFSHQKYWIIDDKDVHLSTGNWNPSDFPAEYDDKPVPANKYPKHYVNRDMLIIMRSPDIVKYFKNIFITDGGIQID